MIKKETEQLERQIEDRNRLFQANLNHRVQAAIVIQRAFRSFLRLKQKGISTTQLLERKQIEMDYGRTQMPTALMENLLDDGRNKLKKQQASKDDDSWSLDDEDFAADYEENGTDDSNNEEDLDDDDRKIPKKTEIFEGQVVQVERLVKEEEELRSQHASVQKKQKPSGRTRILKAQIRRDKQRMKLEKNHFQIIAGAGNQ